MLCRTDCKSVFKVLSLSTEMQFSTDLALMNNTQIINGSISWCPDSCKGNLLNLVSLPSILKEDYQKALKKFFLWNPVPLNGQSCLKQKGLGTSGQSLFRLQNKFRKIPLLVIYYLNKFDDIMRFLSYSKNCICKLMQANSLQHKLFQFNLSFWV